MRRERVLASGRHRLVNAGVVDKDVDSSKAAFDLREIATKSLHVGDVAHNRVAPGRYPLKLVAQVLQQCVASRYADNRGAAHRQVDRYPAPDPRRRTRDDRERTHDPRRSIEERYSNRDEYLGKASQTATRLIDQGYLLKSDLSAILEQAAERWECATGNERAVR